MLKTGQTFISREGDISDSTAFVSSFFTSGTDLADDEAGVVDGAGAGALVVGAGAGALVDGGGGGGGALLGGGGALLGGAPAPTSAE